MFQSEYLLVTMTHAASGLGLDGVGRLTVGHQLDQPKTRPGRECVACGVTGHELKSCPSFTVRERMLKFPKPILETPDRCQPCQEDGHHLRLCPRFELSRKPQYRMLQKDPSKVFRQPYRSSESWTRLQQLQERLENFEAEEDGLLWLHKVFQVIQEEFQGLPADEVIYKFIFFRLSRKVQRLVFYNLSIPYGDYNELCKFVAFQIGVESTDNWSLDLENIRIAKGDILAPLTRIETIVDQGLCNSRKTLCDDDFERRGTKLMRIVVTKLDKNLWMTLAENGCVVGQGLTYERLKDTLLKVAGGTKN